MKKGFVFLIVFGSILLVAGSAAFGLAIAKGAFKNNDFTKEVTKEYDFEDSFTKIDVGAVIYFFFSHYTFRVNSVIVKVYFI